MAPDQVFHIDATQLGALREVAAGSRGRIFAAPAVLINQRWPALYKEYAGHLRPNLDVAALQAMAGLFGELDDGTESWLCERTGWPAAVVTRDGNPCGYLMCQAPAGLVTAADLLTGRAGVGGPALPAALREVEAVLALLHGRGVALGPVDPRKLLLRPHPPAPGQPACFLIGCDAFQRYGAAILPPADPMRSPDTDRAHLAALTAELLSTAPPPPMPAPVAPVPVLEAKPARTGLGWGWIAVLAAILAAVLAVGAVVVANALRGHHPTPVAAPASTEASPPPPTGAPSESATASASPNVGLVDVSAVAQDARAADIATMFDAYFAAINAHDFATALGLYDPAGKIDPTDPKQRQSFADGVRTTTDSAVTLVSISGQAAPVQARVRFVSHQQAGYGPKARPNETCTRWDVTYRLTSPADHQYRIFAAAAATNQPC
jgi:hypothetical protein